MNKQIDTIDKRVARPLKVLVSLIKRDVENAAEAGKMFYIAAGGKLVEAKEGVERGKWEQWLKDNFDFSADLARVWMNWWKAENTTRDVFSTAEEFRRSRSPRRHKNAERKYREYQAPVDHILSGINAKEMRDRAATAAKEYELERKLANQLIKIGLGVLATKLHPDKGGSVDAMRRLNKVAKALREVYSRTSLTY